MKLNRREIKLNRRERKYWWEEFPHFPIKKVVYNNEEGEPTKESLLVFCRKNQETREGVPNTHLLPLDVCMKSVLRFDPKSKDCIKCFGLRKFQRFPEMFLNAKKEVHFPQSMLVVSGWEKKRLEKKINKDKEIVPKEEGNEKTEV